mmetsp:Transcript_26485/g.63823  ORF Transcript_26485/g.63823 Transcript_26485/m.63823 type:complete len:219 (+) Transcript_26485:469-1125(+)
MLIMVDPRHGTNISFVYPPAVRPVRVQRRSQGLRRARFGHQHLVGDQGSGVFIGHPIGGCLPGTRPLQSKILPVLHRQQALRHHLLHLLPVLPGHARHEGHPLQIAPRPDLNEVDVLPVRVDRLCRNGAAAALPLGHLGHIHCAVMDPIRAPAVLGLEHLVNQLSEHRVALGISGNQPGGGVLLVAGHQHRGLQAGGQGDPGGGLGRSQFLVETWLLL